MGYPWIFHGSRTGQHYDLMRNPWEPDVGPIQEPWATHGQVLSTNGRPMVGPWASTIHLLEFHGLPVGYLRVIHKRTMRVSWTNTVIP